MGCGPVPALERLAEFPFVSVNELAFIELLFNENEDADGDCGEGGASGGGGGAPR